LVGENKGKKLGRKKRDVLKKIKVKEKLPQLKGTKKPLKKEGGKLMGLKKRII